MQSIPFQLPEFSKSKIKKVHQYTAPFRKQGIRLGHQFLNSKHLIHNYGHGNSGVTLAYGTAFIAIKAMMIKIDNNMAGNVAVLGAGISAIMTSIQLLKRGFRVTLYSEQKLQLLKMSPQTQKQCIKGHTIWFPDSYDYSQDSLKHQLLSKLQWDYIQDCLKHKRYSSLTQSSVFEFNKQIEQLKQIVPDLIFDNFRSVNLDYGNGQQQAVVQYNTVTFDNSLYFEELKTELILRGGKFVQRKFKDLNDVQNVPENIIINCLGAGSARIFKDDKLEPKTMILVGIQVEGKLENNNWNLRVHLENDEDYQLTSRDGRIKILLPPKVNTEQSNDSFIQKHLSKLDGFFKTRRNERARL